jgi:hypothetical protein
MCKRKHTFLSLFTILLGLMLVIATTPKVAYADEPFPTPDQGTCVNCHENLYFLHDTGKWFCLKAAPMACVDCHGGDPAATTQETAHAHRAAHPVLNENISKCQQCHPEQASERVKTFGQVAGISAIMVSLPYQPAIAAETEVITVTGMEQNENWILALEVAIFILVAGLASTAYFIYKFRHKITPHS